VPVKPEVSGSSPVGPVFKKSELTGIFSIQPFRLLHKKSSSHPYAGSL